MRKASMRTPEEKEMAWLTERMFSCQIDTDEEGPDFEAIDTVLSKVRSKNARIFGLVAQSVRGCITAAIRRGYSAVGGRETVGGLRNDLIQHGIVSISDQKVLDYVLDETYDSAYAMGVAVEKAQRNTETDWLIEMFKAACEARTLWRIFIAHPIKTEKAQAEG